MRYTVAENTWGFGRTGLKYAVVDNAPDRRPMRAGPLHVDELELNTEPGRLPWRHVAFCSTKEDSDRTAAAMNAAERAQIMERY